MATARSTRRPSAPPSDEDLLSMARALFARGDVAGLRSLEAHVLRAPERDRAETACLVGAALVDSLLSERAAGLYQAVLQTTRDRAQKGQLHLHRARAFQELFLVPQAIEEVRAAQEYFGDDATAVQRAELLTVRASLASRLGDQDGAEKHCEQALQIARAAGLRDLELEALLEMSVCALRRGVLLEAERRAQQAVDRAGQEQNSRHAEALRMLAVMHANRSAFLAAILSHRLSLRIYQQQQSPRGLFKGYLSLGLCYLSMGELDPAELFLSKSRTIAEEGEDAASLSLIYSRLGHLHLVRGEPEQALEYYHRDQALSQKLDNPVSRGYPELNLSEASLALRRTTEAAEHATRAIDLFSAVSDSVGQARAHLVLARAQAGASKAEGGERRLGAMTHVRLARELVEPLQRPELSCHCDIAEALVAAASGKLDDGLALFRAGCSVLERLEDVASATHASMWMGETLAAVGAKETAVEILTGALRRAEIHQMHGVRKLLLSRLDALDENAIVDHSLTATAASASSSKDIVPQQVRIEDILGQSRATRSLRRLIARVAPTNVPVLVLGETGTGKELVARSIHAASRRARGPLVVVNCGAIPRELVESELFGHARGAFTGAVRAHIGCLERANRGTVFLDEIGDLPLDAQVKLLRFLAAGEVRRVGETTPLQVDVRVVAATHRDLRRAVEQERFRQDLYFRLSIFEVRVAALHERSEDIPLLAHHFLKQDPLALERGIDRISHAALAALIRYPWPGNVRELENAIRRACVVCDGPAVLREHLPEQVVYGATEARPRSAMTMRDAELERILETLRQCNGNRSQAAAQLGIHRNTLTRKLAKQKS